MLAVNEKKGLRRCNAPGPDVFISLPPGNKRSNALPLLARCRPISCRVSQNFNSSGGLGVGTGRGL